MVPLRSNALCPATMYASRNWANEKPWEARAMLSAWLTVISTRRPRKNDFRSCRFGFGKLTTRSNLPGLRRIAGSSSDGSFAVATTMIPWPLAIPSRVFKSCWRLIFVFDSPDFGNALSRSSSRTIAGRFFNARSNKSSRSASSVCGWNSRRVYAVNPRLDNMHRTAVLLPFPGGPWSRYPRRCGSSA